jgi:hypothetical protein
MADIAMRKFVQLTKVDAKTGEVWGVISSETPDDSGEIMDYAHSKPNFLKWSEKIVKASGGKSKGNVRTMHNGQMVAVGKLNHFEARDETKDFYVGAQIVDKDELAKVYAGVYTGFSIGGSYGQWSEHDGKYRRYEAVPVEVSLVDNPCNPDATFQLVKDDGAAELRKFVTVEEGKPMAEKTTPVTFEDLLKAADAATLKDYAEKLSKVFPPAKDEAAAEEEKKPTEGEQEQEKESETESEGEGKPEEKPAEESPKGEGEAATEPAAKDGEAVAAPTRDDLRLVILGILEELGLVVKEGETIKAAQPADLKKSADALELAKADFAKQKDELAKAITDGDKALAGDIAKLIAENETLSARVEKVTGMGPVVMVPGGASAADSTTQEIEMLKKYQASANSPAEVARFGELIAAAEIRNIHKIQKA